jgi:hypothetical protein|nr:MAG TPA: hypothetical protein [Caudoviricetes sp.]DAY32738.1 MAG TPA: hypothetical protein [Caudoviricetes sp.]
MKQNLVDLETLVIEGYPLFIWRLCSFPLVSKRYDETTSLKNIKDTILLLNILISMHQTTILSQNRELFYQNQFRLDADNFTISKEEGKSVYYIDLCTIDNIVPTKEWLISFTNTIKLHEEEF